LDHFSIEGAPKLKKGEDTAYLSNPDRGVELTFVDAESLDDASRYPDGALVLANIRFYGIPGHAFSPYGGDLPDGLQFGEAKDELLQRLGTPSWVGMNGTKLRWDNNHVRLIVSLNESNKVEIVSLDLSS
jgi:hypothetical protein